MSLLSFFSRKNKAKTDVNDVNELEPISPDFELNHFLYQCHRSLYENDKMALSGIQLMSLGVLLSILIEDENNVDCGRAKVLRYYNALYRFSKALEDEFDSLNKKEIMRSFSLLSDNVKATVTLTVHTMLYIDGMPSRDHLDLANKFFGLMGVNYETYQSIINDAKNANYFPKLIHIFNAPVN